MATLARHSPPPESQGTRKEHSLAYTDPAASPSSPGALPTPAVLGLLVLLAFLSFGRPTLQGFPLVFEDKATLTENAAVRDGQAVQAFTDALLTPARPGDHSGTFRPLTLFSLSLNRSLTGAGPLGLHLVNLLLHILASFLLYLLVRGLLADAGAGLLAAALFACHPMFAGAVGWISGRAEVQMTALALGALVLHRRNAESGGTPILAGVLAFLAMLSHEAGIALVLLAPLVDAAAVRKPKGSVALGNYLGFWVAGIVYVLLRTHAHPYVMNLGLNSGLIVGLTVVKLWFVSAVLGIAPFLSMVLQPVRLGGPLGTELLTRASDPWATAGIVALLALLALGVWQLFRKPAVGAGLLWYLAGFLPLLSTTLALHTSIDRLLYLPVAGLCLAAAGLASAIWRAKPASARIVQAVAVGIGIIFLAVAGARAGMWQDESAYLKQVAARNPHDAKALNDLGGAYMGIGQPAAALEPLRRAHAIDSMDVSVANNLSRAYLALQKPDSAAGVLGAVVEANPGRTDVQSALGDAMNASGRHEEAMKMYSKVLGADSTKVQGYVGMAQSLAGQGKFTEALTALRIASRLSPKDPAIPNDVGLVYQAMDNKESADSAFLAAIKIAPRMPQFHYNRAFLKYHQGDYVAASKEVDQLIALMPGEPGPIKLRDELRSKMAKPQP